MYEESNEKNNMLTSLTLALIQQTWYSAVGRYFTARKRSLRRLCFHRCLSVHGGGPCVAGGACMAGGHVWQRGMWPGGHAWHTRPPGRYYEIRSMSGRYASYWNDFLFLLNQQQESKPSKLTLHCVEPNRGH